jgi:MoxR-like ATPase
MEEHTMSKNKKQTPQLIQTPEMVKLQSLREEMRDIFIEREEEVDGLLTALLSRQHVLLIAPKGTAKSMLVRVLSESIKESKYFERLLTKYSTPDELFGAVMLSALKNDIFKRNIDNHAPSAHFLFLDELFKANSSILNSLLTLLYERKYHNNGSAIDCPLETCVGCSNEFPEGAVLDALYDRFLLKFIPKYIQEDSGFAHMLTATKLTTDTKLTLDEIHTLQETAQKMPLDDTIIRHIVKIRKELAKQGIQPSDRRYKQAQSCVKGYALLNGRQKVTPDDLRILKDILWDRQEEMATVETTITQNVNPYGAEMTEIVKAINEALKGLSEQEEDGKKVLVAAEIASKMKKSVKRMEELRTKMDDEGRDLSVIETEIQKAKDRLNKVVKENLEL